MNRIILIGNGFDLAHDDLKTSYKDFIDWFWKKEIEKIKWCRGQYDKFNYLDGNYFGIEGVTENDIQFLQKEQNKNYKNLKQLCDLHQVRFNFKNSFLEQISERALINWVDIEEEYYRQIKNVIQGGSTIKKLNKDFEKIKKELENYLSGIQQHTVITTNDNFHFKIYSKFQLNDISNTSLKSLVDTIQNKIISTKK